MSDRPIKQVELSKEDFFKLKEKLLEEYGNKILISWVLKRECGFTVRTHHAWTEQHGSETIYCLDFYEEKMKTWFCLKYL